MDLIYIKSKSGEIFYPQEPGIKDESKNYSNYPVCLIKKLSNNRFQIDYYDNSLQFEIKGSYSVGDENKPNKRVVLYPSGIEEIVYKH